MVDPAAARPQLFELDSSFTPPNPPISNAAVLAELSDIVDLPERAAAVEELMEDDSALVSGWRDGR